MQKENILKASEELNKWEINEMAERQIRRMQNDGLTIKIPQENVYDKFVNLVDKRRIVLEKKAEILQDYYGDSRLGKDLFLDHLNDTRLYDYSKYLLTASLLGYNTYSKLIHRTVLMGWPSLVLSLVGVHATTRYLSNNSLESRIERPWKIHTYRMSKGLGPTNVKWNTNKGTYTNFMDRSLYRYKPDDYLYRTIQSIIPVSVKEKIPVDKKNFPWIPEGLDILKFGSYKVEKDKNMTKYNFNVPKGSRLLNNYDILNFVTNQKKKLSDYNPFKQFDTFRPEFMNGIMTIYRPQHEEKYDTLEARSEKEIIREGELISPINEYERNNLFSMDSEIKWSLPEYYDRHLHRIVNWSKDVKEKFGSYF